MECPNCHQPVETGATFCGNCGTRLVAQMPTQTPPQISPQTPSPNLPQAPSPIAQVMQNGPPAPTVQAAGPPLMAIGGVGLQSAIPNYAVAAPSQRHGETRTLIAILCGVTGMVGALFIPLIGLGLGLTGIIIATTAWSSARHWPIRIGFALSCLALIAGLASWAYVIKHDPRLNPSKANQGTTASKISASLSTPCYSTNFVNRLNIANNQGSCNMTAYNGQTLNTSSDAYKVYATQAAIINTTSFTNLAKQGIEKDIQTNLPGFTIDNEQVSAFAGSPSYEVNAEDKAEDVAVIEAVVYHTSSKSTDNVYTLVHITTGSAADLSVMEAQWQWK